MRNMAAFRDGETRTLVSCRCLDEGIDVPDANVAIVLSGAAVSRQHIQRLGRILRTSPDKDSACLYYLYIRESSESPSYLDAAEAHETVSLRYYTAEGTFSNEIYEYVASQILSEAADRPETYRAELRKCLLEGLTRADCLLPEPILSANITSAKTRHERNYWKCMKAVARRLVNSEPGGDGSG